MFLRACFLLLVAVVTWAPCTPAAAEPLFEELSDFFRGPVKPSQGALVRAADGYLWGTSQQGGQNNDGMIYKVKPDGSDLRVVHALPVNSTQADDGILPLGGLTDDGAGYLWGTTTSGVRTAQLGTVFKIKVSDGTFTTVVRFSGNEATNKGSYPVGTLVKVGSSMWGTTRLGGAANAGTVFKVLMSSGALTTVAQFTGTAGATKGSFPLGGLLFEDNQFWGMTSAGGATFDGTIFTLTPTGTFATVLEFTETTGPNKGAFPDGVLASDGAGSLWATTQRGGAPNLGTIFKLNKTTKVLTTMVEFTGTGGTRAGARPTGTLVPGAAGTLWGVTQEGGAPNAGTVFSITPGGVFTSRTEFTGGAATQTGANPMAPLVSDGAGNFVGTLSLAGGDGVGRIFRINQTSGAVSRVADFLGLRRAPNSGLTADRQGNLWGTTADFFSNGAIYKYNPATGDRTSVAAFTDLEDPRGTLYFDGDQTFWGVASDGGANRDGGIYRVNASTGVIATVVSFTGRTGANKGDQPEAGLVSDGAGFLWGSTAKGGADDAGTIFKYNPASGVFTTVVEFTDNGAVNKGEFPAEALVDDGAGFFWGTTRYGGDGGGTIFKIRKSSGALTTVKTFVDMSGVPGRYPTLGVKFGTNLWGAGINATIKVDLTNDANPVTLITSKPTDGRFVPDGLGQLWDTSATGGGKLQGSITKLNPATGLVTNIFAFNGAGAATLNGSQPVGPLLAHTDGYFYGVTQYGGLDSGGTLFRVANTGGVAPTFETVATVGAKVPGPQTQRTYGALGAPQTGAFAGTLFWEQPKVAAIFAPDGSLRVKVGDPVASINNVAIKTLGEPNGDVVKATLQAVAPVSLKDDEVLLGGLTSGPWKVIARENQALAGLTDVRLKKVMSFDGNGPDCFLLAQLQGMGVTTKNDMALCVAPGDGTLRALVREGDLLSGKSVTTIGTLVAVAKSTADSRWRATGQSFGARLTFSDKTQAYFTVPSSATMPEQWAQGLTTNADFSMNKISTLGFPGFGQLGPAGVVTLKAGAQPVDPKRNILVVRTDSEGSTILASKGEPVPDGAGVAIPKATFLSFLEPVSGFAGRTAFMATLAGVTPTAGLWYTADGDNLRQLARAGDPAPGGGVWSTFTQLVLPGGPAGGPHFLGTLKADRVAGISTANNSGLWSVTSTGLLQLTVRTGQQFDVNNATRTLKSFVAFKTAVDSLGAARGYDDAGHVAILATFTDKSVALLRLTVP